MAMTQFTGLQYLMIDVANNFGLGKKDWSERLDWFKANEGKLESLVKSAEKPALYYAGIKAYRKAQRGEVVQYPISLDATSSGLQILACLTGDREAAMICNVLDAGKRCCAYNLVYEHMLKALGKVPVLTDKNVKRAVMTSLYSSQAVPKEVFGDESPELAQFYKTMETLAPAAWELNTAFLNMWDPKAYSNDWTLPDNFNVKVKVMVPMSEEVTFLGKRYPVNYAVNAPAESGRSLGANVTHSIDGMLVREMNRRCNYDPLRVDMVRQLLAGKDPVFLGTSGHIDDEMVSLLWQHYLDSGFLSARILDHLNKDNLHIVQKDHIQELVDSLPTKPFKILTVHDCFRCLPNQGNDMRWQYTNLLALVAKSELLSFILSQLMGQHVPVNKFDPHMWKEVMNSDYAIC